MPDEMLSRNLLAPAVLAFVLGVLARLGGSDLRFPEAISKGLSIYLLFAIGLKGGAAMADQQVAHMALPALAAVLLGAATAFSAFTAAGRLLRLPRGEAGAMAAHYGSTSAVTFLAAATYLSGLGVAYEAAMPALLVLMEIPGIAIGLWFAGAGRSWSHLREVFFGSSIILLIGGMAVGAMTHLDGLKAIKGFFVDPFVGVLCLFLLDLGTIAAERLRALAAGWWRLVLFAVGLAVVHGLLGTAVGALVGLSAGGAALLGVLAASASYIAAPAAVRHALPEADLGRCLAAALGMTFPFNLALGIPLYHAWAEWLVR